MNDRIHLFDVRLQCHIGVPEEERRTAQEIVLDISMEGDWRHAAATESITDTVDYAKVLDAVEALTHSRPWVLVETLAESICQQLLQQFPIHSARVLLRKPAALRHRGVGAPAVEIERRRNG